MTISTTICLESAISYFYDTLLKNFVYIIKQDKVIHSKNGGSGQDFEIFGLSGEIS